MKVAAPFFRIYGVLPYQSALSHFVMLKKFMAKEWRRASAQRRGGGRSRVDLDPALAESQSATDSGSSLAPEEAFDRQWALTLLNLTVARLREEFAAAGRSADFGTLTDCLMSHVEGGLAPAPGSTHAHMAVSFIAVAILIIIIGGIVLLGLFVPKDGSVRKAATWGVGATMLILGLTARASDWPQFLGPTRNAVYAGTPLAKEWPSEGPKVLWRAAVGEGYSSPVVSEGRLIIAYRVGDELVVHCFETLTGKNELVFSISDEV